MTELIDYRDIIAQTKRSFIDIVNETGNAVAFKKEAHNAMYACETNPQLMDAAVKNPESLRRAIWNVATVGLSLDRSTQYAFLVNRPRYDKATRAYIPEICLDISYRGLTKIATDTGSILYAKAEMVYEKDIFNLREIGKPPEHKFAPFGDRGEAIGVYCVAKTADGDYLVDVMTADEVGEIRKKSVSANSEKGKEYSPWNTFEHEMWKKCVIKRASKTWPKTERSSRLQTAIEVVNEHEGIEFKPPEYTPLQLTYFKSLIGTHAEGSRRESQPLEYFLFVRDLEPEEYQGMISAHIKTFPARSKPHEHGRTAEKRFLEQLIDSGKRLFYGYLDELTNLDTDEFRILEILQNELPETVVPVILNEVTQESINRIDHIKQSAEQ